MNLILERNEFEVFSSILNCESGIPNSYKIAEILESIDTGKIFPADTEFNFKERLAVKNQLVSQFIPWVRKFLNGLETFSHKYIANGNSDALNMLFMKRDFRRICFLKNEYSYYSHLCKALNIEYIEVDPLDISLLSNTDLYKFLFEVCYLLLKGRDT